MLNQPIADDELVDAMDDRACVFDRVGERTKVDVLALHAQIRANGLGVDLRDCHIRGLDPGTLSTAAATATIPGPSMAQSTSSCARRIFILLLV